VLPDHEFKTRVLAGRFSVFLSLLFVSYWVSPLAGSHSCAKLTRATVLFCSARQSLPLLCILLIPFVNSTFAQGVGDSGNDVGTTGVAADQGASLSIGQNTPWSFINMVYR
jgi:hypothetical protein